MGTKKSYLFLILLVFSMSGCASFSEAQPELENEYIVSKSSNLSEIHQLALDYNNEFYCEFYTIDKTQIVEKNGVLGSYININYPRMSGYADKSKETLINEMLYKKVEELYSLTDINHNYNECLDMSYSITYADANIISICYLGAISYNTRVNHFAKTVTIELHSLEKVELGDMISIKAIEDNIANMKYLSSREDLDYVYKENEEILRYFRESFPEEEQQQQINNFYIKKNTVGIVIRVPQAAGDYLLLEFSNLDPGTHNEES